MPALAPDPTPAEQAPPVNILLVDDEPRNLDLLETFLHSPDHQLVRATSGEQALGLLREGVFAVIVLDIRMPGMSGLELAALIKQHPRTRHLPIIFLTAYFPGDEYVRQGYGSGAVDYLTKPVTPDILRSKIAVFVDLFRKTQALAATNVALEAQIARREQAEAQLRQMNDELEARVAARTAELVRLNEELQHRERALRASEAQLRFVTDTAPVFIAQFDRAHRFKFVNRTCALRCGFAAEAMIGKSLAEVIGDGAYAEIRPHLDAALAGKRVEFEAEIPHDSPDSRWVFAVHEPEHGPDGEIIGLLAVASDITERKLVEQEIAAARDNALTAARAKDDFLARLSHELRTPLNPVLLLASEAAGDPSLPAPVRATFDTIARNVTLEAQLIDDLLDLTAITRGKLSLAMQCVPIHRILQDAIALVQPEITQKRLRLDLAFEPSQPTVFGDDLRLKQICWNIIKNAVKFTPADGQVTVATRTHPAQHKLTIAVTDTGIGFTAEESARIFAAFAQGDHASTGHGRFGGLGLGLVISRLLVHLHSGTITASSDGPGRGATFTIELPLSPTATAGRKRPDRSPVFVSRFEDVPPVAPRPFRVLLVEDHPPTCAALAGLLTRRHYRVVTANTMAEARTAATRGSFDFVISDVGLPDGNGCELMTELRARYGLPGVALTGYGMDDDLVRSHAAGFVAHLTKPVSVRALDDALARMAALHQPADHAQRP